MQTQGFNPNSISVRRRFIDDRLAHGYAYNVLRELADESERARRRFIRALKEPTANRTSNERRANRLLRDLGELLAPISIDRQVWRGPQTSRSKGLPIYASWCLLAEAGREGARLLQLRLTFEKRSLPCWEQSTALSITPHVLARIFQRDMLLRTDQVVQLLHPLASYLDVVMTLANHAGHRQFGVPVGDGGLVVGEILPKGDDQETPTVLAKTYFRPTCGRWLAYKELMAGTMRAARANPVYGSDGDGLNLSERNSILMSFSGERWRWLQEPYDPRAINCRIPEHRPC